MSHTSHSVIDPDVGSIFGIQLLAGFGRNSTPQHAHDASSSVRNDDRRLPSTSAGVNSEAAARRLPLRPLSTNTDTDQTIRDGKHLQSGTSSQHVKGKGGPSVATHKTVTNSASSYDFVSKGAQEYNPSIDTIQAFPRPFEPKGNEGPPSGSDNEQSDFCSLSRIDQLHYDAKRRTAMRERRHAEAQQAREAAEMREVTGRPVINASSHAYASNSRSASTSSSLTTHSVRKHDKRISPRLEDTPPIMNSQRRELRSESVDAKQRFHAVGEDSGKEKRPAERGAISGSAYNRLPNDDYQRQRQNIYDRLSALTTANVARRREAEAKNDNGAVTAVSSNRPTINPNSAKIWEAMKQRALSETTSVAKADGTAATSSTAAFFADPHEKDNDHRPTAEPVASSATAALSVADRLYGNARLRQREEAAKKAQSDRMIALEAAHNAMKRQQIRYEYQSTKREIEERKNKREIPSDGHLAIDQQALPENHSSPPPHDDDEYASHTKQPKERSPLQRHQQRRRDEAIGLSGGGGGGGSGDTRSRSGSSAAVETHAAELSPLPSGGDGDSYFLDCLSPLTDGTAGSPLPPPHANDYMYMNAANAHRSKAGGGGGGEWKSPSLRSRSQSRSRLEMAREEERNKRARLLAEREWGSPQQRDPDNNTSSSPILDIRRAYSAESAVTTTGSEEGGGDKGVRFSSSPRARSHSRGGASAIESHSFVYDGRSRSSDSHSRLHAHPSAHFAHTTASSFDFSDEVVSEAGGYAGHFRRSLAAGGNANRSRSPRATHKSVYASVDMTMQTSAGGQSFYQHHHYCGSSFDANTTRWSAHPSPPKAPRVEGAMLPLSGAATSSSSAKHVHHFYFPETVSEERTEDVVSAAITVNGGHALRHTVTSPPNGHNDRALARLRDRQRLFHQHQHEASRAFIHRIEQIHEEGGDKEENKAGSEGSEERA